MTGNEVIQAIKLALDKYSASASAVIGPAFLDEELCEFANQAMIETICTKFTGHNQLQQGFEQSVKRVADLERLILGCATTLTNADAGSNRMRTVSSYSDRYLFLVSMRLRLTKSDNNCVYLPVELTDRATAQRFEQTPTNYPYIPIPKAITSNNSGNNSNGNKPYRSFVVFLDPTLIDEIGHGKTYNKAELLTEHVWQPARMDVSKLEESAFEGLLPLPVIYEIINKAALLALDNIESQRTEVKASLNNTQE